MNGISKNIWKKQHLPAIHEDYAERKKIPLDEMFKLYK